MNKEEILEKSREEKNVLDERDRAIQTKANSISQGVGMILCIVMGAIGFGITQTADFLWCALSILWGMFACERIVCAIKSKSAGQWVLASIITLGFLAAVVVYVLCLLNIV